MLMYNIIFNAFDITFLKDLLIKRDKTFDK